MPFLWIFSEMSLNQFEDREPTDPNADYTWGLKDPEGNTNILSGISYSEVQLLMRHFGVESPQALVGKSFGSKLGAASIALDLLLTQIRHDGNYVPPTREQVRQMAAEALARLKEPDFSAIDGMTLAEAFAEVWHGFSADADWLSQFQRRIAELSGGAVQLKAADVDRFPYRIKGPAEYLELARGDEIKLVVIGPYSTPVTVV